MKKFFVRAMPCKRGRPAGLGGSSNPTSSTHQHGLALQQRRRRRLGDSRLGCGLGSRLGGGLGGGGRLGDGLRSGRLRGRGRLLGLVSRLRHRQRRLGWQRLLRLIGSSRLVLYLQGRRWEWEGRWLWVLGGGMVGGQEGKALRGSQ